MAWRCLLIAVVALAGCASHTPVVHTPLEDQFSAGADLMRGFDHQAAGEGWRPGDSVLLGVSIEGAGEPRQMYIRVTVTEKPMFTGLDGLEGTFTAQDSADFKVTPAGGEPHLVRVRFELVMLYVETFDGKGKKISATPAMMPEPCLKYGLIEYVEQEQSGLPFEHPDRQGLIVSGVSQATESQVREVAGWLALLRLPMFLGREKSMGSAVNHVIRSPGLGSIILNGGVSVSLGMQPKEAAAVPAPAPWTGPCYRVPLGVEANGKRAADCTLTITRADPPLGPCNGLLELEASHPDDPGKRVRMRLLAAKRGKPPSPTTPSP